KQMTMASSKNTFTVREIRVSYSSRKKVSELPRITRPLDAYELFRASWDSDTIEYIEQCKVMLLNRSKRVLGIATVSVGGTGNTIIDPKVVFGIALKGNASSIILAHNHPSGNVQPSRMDIGLTQRLSDIGKILDLPLD